METKLQLTPKRKTEKIRSRVECTVFTFLCLHLVERSSEGLPALRLWMTRHSGFLGDTFTHFIPGGFLKTTFKESLTVCMQIPLFYLSILHSPLLRITLFYAISSESV